MPDSSVYILSFRERKEDAFYCDVTIQVEGKDIKAHKSILGPSCAFFDKMFRTKVNTDHKIKNSHYFTQILKVDISTLCSCYCGAAFSGRCTDLVWVGGLYHCTPLLTF